jgi:hypothetical protein
MKHVYILVTDGSRGLFLKEKKIYSFINHSIWPIIKPMSSVHWPVALVKHATYGLLNITGSYTWATRPFGLPYGSSFVVARVSSETLETLVENFERIYSWHKYNANFQCPWKLKIMPLDISVEQLDLMSAHCLKAFLDTRPDATPEAPNFGGPSSSHDLPI